MSYVVIDTGMGKPTGFTRVSVTGRVRVQKFSPAKNLYPQSRVTGLGATSFRVGNYLPLASTTIAAATTTQSKGSCKSLFIYYSLIFSLV
jgi:hypothetical protein